MLRRLLSSQQARVSDAADVEADKAVQVTKAWPTVEMVARGVSPNGSLNGSATMHGKLVELVYLPALDPQEQALGLPI